MPRVSGIVLDRFTGDPIQGALVIICGRRTTSDSEGRFSFEDVPVGRCFASCYAEGYESAARVVDVTGDITLTFLLTPKVGLL